MNPHQRCLQAKVKNQNEPKQVMQESRPSSPRSLEINVIWIFDTKFPIIFNKTCTYNTFKSAVAYRQLSYGVMATCPPIRGNHSGHTFKYHMSTSIN